jgi:hypothetical protein
MTMTYWVKNKDVKGRGLEAQIYQFDPVGGYTQLELVKSLWEADNGPETTGLTAYNAVGKLKPKSEDKPPRSATFVAAIRLFEGEATGRETWSEVPPTPQEFYDHIGVNPLGSKATGAMWERIFLDPRTYGTGLEPVLNLAEFNMIGRSLEKILQVDVIPAIFKDGDEAQYSALVSNLFVKANVDLKALL